MTERLGDAPKAPLPHPAPGAFQAPPPRRHAPRAPGRKRPTPPPRSPGPTPTPSRWPCLPRPGGRGHSAASCPQMQPLSAPTRRCAPDAGGDEARPTPHCPRRTRRSSSGSEQQSQGSHRPHPPRGPVPSLSRTSIRTFKKCEQKRRCRQSRGFAYYGHPLKRGSRLSTPTPWS